jgi:[ribosomal protein S5]-alanine N-acetyltransferase
MEDADAMYRVLGDPVVMRFSDGVKSKEQVAAWITRWVDELYGNLGFGFWAVVEKQEKRTLGYCGLTRFAGRCEPGETEIGFRLAQTHWGKGLASEAAAAVRDYAFGSLHLPKLIAIIDPANVAAIRVATKIDFRYERDVMFEGYDHPDHVHSLANPAEA